MTFEEKVAYFVHDLERQGLDRATARPPLVRWLWRHGLKVPPMVFIHPVLLGSLCAAYAGIPLALLLRLAVQWLTGVRMWPALPLFALWMGILGGVIWGVHVAVLFRRLAGQLSLPSWKNYPHPST